MISQNFTYRWKADGRGILKHEARELHEDDSGENRSGIVLAAIAGRTSTWPVVGIGFIQCIGMLRQEL
jgi:hypothetical protein